MKRRDFFRSTVAAAVVASLPRNSAFAFPYRLAQQDFPDVNAVRGDGRPVALKGSELRELKGALRGRLQLSNS
jgi:hypothetical protein